MQKLFDRIGFILLMNLFWISFLDAITPGWVLIGFLLSLGVKVLSDYLFNDVYHFYMDFYFIRCWLHYSFNLFTGIIRAGFKLIPVLIRGSDRPIVFVMQVAHKDPLVHTLVANAITLTPGTITLEASPEGELIVLSMVDDQQDGKTFAQEIIHDYVRPFQNTVYREASQ